MAKREGDPSNGRLLAGNRTDRRTMEVRRRSTRGTLRKERSGDGTDHVAVDGEPGSGLADAGEGRERSRRVKTIAGRSHRR